MAEASGDGKGLYYPHPVPNRYSYSSLGPRWIGHSLPSLPPELQYAQDLPPKVTDKYVLFFGFDGPEPECCLQQWYPSPFTESDPKTGGTRHFRTSEQYMMYHKALLSTYIDEQTATRATWLARGDSNGTGLRFAPHHPSSRTCANPVSRRI